MPEFLPISRADMQRRGWEQCDFVYIIGDGYVDHPSFGHAIISRVLEDAGYKVGIISSVQAQSLCSAFCARSFFSSASMPALSPF